MRDQATTTEINDWKCIISGVQTYMGRYGVTMTWGMLISDDPTVRRFSAYGAIAEMLAKIPAGTIIIASGTGTQGFYGPMVVRKFRMSEFDSPNIERVVASEPATTKTSDSRFAPFPIALNGISRRYAMPN